MGALTRFSPALAARDASDGRFWPRLAIAAALLTAAGWTWSWLHRPASCEPHFPIGQQVERVLAAARAAHLPPDADAELGRIDDRIAFEQREAAADTSDWMAWESIAGLSLARAQLGGDYRDFGEAEAALDRAFAIAPPGSGPHLARAGFNLAVHRIGAVATDLDAVRHYRVQTEAAPAALLGLEGEAAFFSGRYAEALAAYRQAYEGTPSLAGAVRLAYYESVLGSDAKALHYLDLAEAGIYGPDLPSRSFLERTRGQFALRRGDWEEARRHFVAADRLFPGQWLNLYYLGVAAASAGETDRALALFEALGGRRRIPEAMDAAALVHRMRGKRQTAEAWAAQAETVWRERMRLLPEAAAAHRLDHLLAFGSPAEALAVARQAFAARPFAESRIGLAWALIANNRPDQALAALAPAQAAGWRSAELHLAASRALALLGRGDAAEAELKAALSLNPRLAERDLPPFLMDH